MWTVVLSDLWWLTTKYKVVFTLQSTFRQRHYKDNFDSKFTDFFLETCGMLRIKYPRLCILPNFNVSQDEKKKHHGIVYRSLHCMVRRCVEAPCMTLRSISFPSEISPFYVKKSRKMNSENVSKAHFSVPSIKITWKLVTEKVFYWETTALYKVEEGGGQKLFFTRRDGGEWPSCPPRSATALLLNFIWKLE